MDGYSELAKMLKDRDNKPYIGPQVGKVESMDPSIKVSLGDSILLESEDLIIAGSIVPALDNGDEVILIPSGDYQTYYLLDRAVRL